ncbi:MAG: ABC transporter ATP-binding protein [Clostridia bacterium]|nr:ABC transporter ATP-binding protein [Clostridia bacterium]
MSILELEKISFSYDGKNYVLKDYSCTFERGKIYAIIGKSGAGKTTLLSLLAGLDKVKEGKILYDGKEVSNIDRYSYRNSNVGVVFQSYNLLPKLTAKENVELSMEISKKKIKDKRKRAAELLNKVGLLDDEIDRRVLKLSGGQQQRVAIARALSFEPDIILADEPTGNLDPETQNEILKIFRKIAQEDNKCVIVVTHSDSVASQADVVYELKKR